MGKIDNHFNSETGNCTQYSFCKFSMNYIVESVNSCLYSTKTILRAINSIKMPPRRFKHTNVVLLLLSVIILAGCAPMSKESYLERYGEFIDEVSSEHSNYSESDWKDSDDRYFKYSEEWYEKFEDEFTFQEKVRLVGYEVQYNALKAKSGVENFFEGFLEKNYDELRKEVKSYADNDMHEDLEEIINSAKVAGDTAVRVLNQIFAELEIDPETLEPIN